MANHHDDELPADALMALQAGRKLEAVNIVRQQRGVSLNEAKALVERSGRDFTTELPRTSQGREDHGVLRLVAILALLGAAAAALLLL